jgi:alpha-N-arabinofuranosidase
MRVDAIAAKDTNGKLWLEITNVDPDQAVEVKATVTGFQAKSAPGETLTSTKVDSVNTSAEPDTVAPKPVSAKIEDGKLTLHLAPKSITVTSVQ